MCTIIHKSYKASYKLAPNQSLQNDLYKKGFIASEGAL